MSIHRRFQQIRRGFVAGSSVENKFGLWTTFPPGPVCPLNSDSIKHILWVINIWVRLCGCWQTSDISEAVISGFKCEQYKNRSWNGAATIFRQRKRPKRRKKNVSLSRWAPTLPSFTETKNNSSSMHCGLPTVAIYVDRNLFFIGNRKKFPRKSNHPLDAKLRPQSKLSNRFPSIFLILLLFPKSIGIVTQSGQWNTRQCAVLQRRLRVIHMIIDGSACFKVIAKLSSSVNWKFINLMTITAVPSTLRRVQITSSCSVWIMREDFPLFFIPSWRQIVSKSALIYRMHGKQCE